MLQGYLMIWFEAFFNTMYGEAYKYIWPMTPALQCHCIVVLTVTSSDLIICPDNIEDGHDTVPIQVPTARAPPGWFVICLQTPAISVQVPPLGLLDPCYNKTWICPPWNVPVSVYIFYLEFNIGWEIWRWRPSIIKVLSNHEAM